MKKHQVLKKVDISAALRIFEESTQQIHNEPLIHPVWVSEVFTACRCLEPDASYISTRVNDVLDPDTNITQGSIFAGLTFRTNRSGIQGSISQSLLWRHNEHDNVSNHQPHDCLLNRLCRRRSKKTSKPRVTGLCAGNSPETGEFPAQMASNAENVSIWWRHHDDYAHGLRFAMFCCGCFWLILSISFSYLTGTVAILQPWWTRANWSIYIRSSSNLSSENQCLLYPKQRAWVWYNHKYARNFAMLCYWKCIKHDSWDIQYFEYESAL